MNDTVEIIPNGDGDMNRAPAQGAETLSLLQNGPSFPAGTDGASVCDEALRILTNSVPADEVRPTARVGLVTGYVQSGKTANYIALCALARDNGYPLIIVITGISTNLFGQSTNRIVQGLRIDRRDDRPYLHIPIETRGASVARKINEALAEWRDGRVPPDRRRTVLLTVMKNHRHLDTLTRALQLVPEVQHVAAIVVDDEGDQASLNYLAAQNRESTTYRQIADLRRLLPRHTYLQYTATPQAPLLVNIIDALSPEFVDVLTPGSGYTGGQVFFVQRPELVRRIPAAEIITPQNPLTEPPESFLVALATYFVGVSSGRIRDNGRGNRSMLVHPHQTRQRHDIFFTWAQSIKDHWLRALDGVGEPEDVRQDVLARFRAAWEDLASTVPPGELPPWEEIIDDLPLAIRATDIQEINAARGATPDVPWRERYAHILVGGQAMDRGFTVEGLTVTYMPRPAGDGNADTIQQRARFFGYKGRYLGYCRVWLEPNVATLFERYVEHEEDVRKRLVQARDNHESLRDWRRKFFLDRALRPTRRQVVTLPFMRVNRGERWVHLKYPHLLSDVVASNNSLIEGFLRGRAFEDVPGITPHQQHHVVRGLRLAELYRELLEELRVPHPEDAAQNIALLLQIESWLERHPDAGAEVYVMRPSVAPARRALGRQNELQTFFQGANPSTGPNQGQTYPGDAAFHDSSNVTVQLHRLHVHTADGRLDIPSMWVSAVHVSQEIGADLLLQQ